MDQIRTNADRAAAAVIAVDAFMAIGGTDKDDAIADLITNLCHLQRGRCEVRGEAFDAATFLRHRADMHDIEAADDDDGTLAFTAAATL